MLNLSRLTDSLHSFAISVQTGFILNLPLAVNIDLSKRVNLVITHFLKILQRLTNAIRTKSKLLSLQDFSWPVSLLQSHQSNLTTTTLHSLQTESLAVLQMCWTSSHAFAYASSLFLSNQVNLEDSVQAALPPRILSLCSWQYTLGIPLTKRLCHYRMRDHLIHPCIPSARHIIDNQKGKGEKAEIG